MNMSYCRFQNTLMDLRDCQEHMDDGDLSEEEKDARAELINVCWRIAQDYANEQGEEDEMSEEQALTAQTIDKYGDGTF
jgi:hypothetical protein